MWKRKGPRIANNLEKGTSGKLTVSDFKKLSTQLQ